MGNGADGMLSVCFHFYNPVAIFIFIFLNTHRMSNGMQKDCKKICEHSLPPLKEKENSNSKKKKVQKTRVQYIMVSA